MGFKLGYCHNIKYFLSLRFSYFQFYTFEKGKLTKKGKLTTDFDLFL